MLPVVLSAGCDAADSCKLREYSTRYNADQMYLVERYADIRLIIPMKR